MQALNLFPGSLVLAMALGAFSGFTAEAAVAKSRNPAADKFKAAAESANTNSVETIAAAARGSVVVISHFGRDGSPDGLGAGFIVASNGLIATCLHVIGEARPITVQLADGHSHEAKEIYAWDRKLDLAVIRIEATGLPVLALGDSDALKQGAPVVAIGNPRGLQHSVVQGVISAKREFDFAEMLQLAIPVEPGNSGGPVLDMQGRVEGILSMKSAITPNLGFALPVNALKPLLARPNAVPMNRWLTIGALNTNEWLTVFGARWSRRTGQIVGDGLGQGFGGRSLCLWQKPVPQPPCELAVDVRLDDESGAAGLAFGSDGQDKHYGFYPTAGRLRLTRFEGPNVFTWTILKELQSPHYRAGEWNTLKVRYEKGKILCYVNGQLVIESDDDTLPPGKVGLVKFREPKAAFKNFQVANSIPASQTPPEQLAAVTMKIRAFADQSEAEALESLRGHSELSQPILSERARDLEREAARLRHLAGALHQNSVRETLLKLLAEDDEKIDLFDAALWVAKLDNRDLDLEAYRGELTDMARDLSARLPKNADDLARLEALRHFLFVENGFHGSRTDYYDRANSYINEVLDDREGIPITLSVVFMELARRIGLKAVEGVPLPGHFVVRFKPKKGEPQLIDVFDGGKSLARDAAERLVLDYTGGSMRENDFEPATKRQIIARMLRNLAGIARRTETPDVQLRYCDLIVALEPDAAVDRWSRAMLRYQTGDHAGARQDLKWLLDHEAPGLDREQILEFYRSF